MAEYSAIEVYTMTCTCTTDNVDDLERVFRGLPIGRTIVSCKSPSGATRGDHKTGREGAFGHNVSCTLKVPSQDRPIHAKLFKTGSIQIAGALSLQSAHEAAGALCDAAGISTPVDMRTRLMNCGLRVGSRLNLARCRDAMRERGIRNEYDPDRYSAVKACVFFGRGADGENRCACAVSCADKSSKNRLCQMVTVCVFESGAILVSGGASMSNVSAAVARIKECVDAGAASSVVSILAKLKAMCAA
jgi:TATA-box binding protein (TBP) (component of TFIID and TFIIIB)